MKRIFGILLVLVLVLCGSLIASDYTFSNGYYWKGGQAFTRSVVQTYDARGCLVNSYQYTPLAAAVTAATPNWRTKLLEIAETQKKYEAQLKASAAEHAEYMEAIKALGYGGGHVSVESYSQRTAPQGSTIYGYNEIADIYGNVDLGDLYQSAIRLAESSSRYGAEATSGVQQLVDNFGDRASGLMSQQLAIAEIQAKTAGVSSAAKALGDAIKAESRVHVERHVQTPQPPAPGGSPILDEPQAKAAENLNELVANKCVHCHGGKTTEANLNLSDLTRIDQPTVAKILARITSANPEKRMPPNKPLTADEIRFFFEASK